MKPFSINVIVYGAKGLKSKSGKHKFCIEAKVNKTKQKTELIEDLFGNPTFNKEFIFPTDNLNNELKLKVKEKNDKDILGQIKIHLSDLQRSKSDTPERAPLRPHKKCPNPSGEVLFDAWVEGSVDPMQANLKKKTTSIESLKSLTGLKKLKEKLHASALKLHHSKKDDDDEEENNEGEKKKKNKLFSLKSRGAVSCQDLSHSQKGFSLFSHKTSEKKSNLNPNVNPSPGGSIENLSNKDNFNFFDKKTLSPTAAAAASIMKYRLPAPEVTGLSPKSGSTKGGTVVTIRGSNLGEQTGDLMHVYICGIDMVKSTKFISSTKLVCTTLPCQPCSGNVIIETKFGGLGSSCIEFSFVEDIKLSPDYEELKMFTDTISDSNGISSLDKHENVVISNAPSSIGNLTENNGGSLLKNRNLGIIRENSLDEFPDEKLKVNLISDVQSHNKPKGDASPDERVVIYSNVDKVLAKSTNDQNYENISNGNKNDSNFYENIVEKDKSVHSADKDDDENDDADDGYSVLVNKLTGNRNSIKDHTYNNTFSDTNDRNIYNNNDNIERLFNDYDKELKYNENFVNNQGNIVDVKKSNNQIVFNHSSAVNFSEPSELKTSYATIEPVQNLQSRENKKITVNKIIVDNVNKQVSDDDEGYARSYDDNIIYHPQAAFKISHESEDDDDGGGLKNRKNSSKLVGDEYAKDTNFKSELKCNLNSTKSSKQQFSDDDEKNVMIDKIVTGDYAKNSVEMIQSNKQQQSSFSSTTTTITISSLTTNSTSTNVDFQNISRDKPSSSSLAQEVIDVNNLSRRSIIALNSEAIFNPNRLPENKSNENLFSTYSTEKKIVEIQPLNRNGNDSKNNLYIRNSSNENSRNNSADRLDKRSLHSDDMSDFNDKTLSDGKVVEQRKKIIPDFKQFNDSFDQDLSLTSSNNSLNFLPNVNSNEKTNGEKSSEKSSGNNSPAPVKPPRMKDIIQLDDLQSSNKNNVTMKSTITSNGYDSSAVINNNDDSGGGGGDGGGALLNGGDRRTFDSFIGGADKTAIIHHFKASEVPMTSSSLSSPSSLSSSSSTTLSSVHNNVDHYYMNSVIQKLSSDLEAQDQVLKELRIKNESLQEERDLLRRYIEVLISRALSSCPEILSRDDRKVSFK